ncbi:unnamed protein product [Lampetra planeri]
MDAFLERRGRKVKVLDRNEAQPRGFATRDELNGSRLRTAGDMAQDERKHPPPSTHIDSRRQATSKQSTAADTEGGRPRETAVVFQSG